MKRNRRNNAKNSTKKERAIMIASSAFVLAALTMTGIYMKSNDMESENDGYSLDLADMGSRAEDKANEIAQNVGDGEETAEQEGGTIAQNDNGVGLADLPGELPGESLAQGKNADDALDFMPLEADASLVEIPGPAGGENGAEVADGNDAETATVNSTTVTNALQFAESDGLLKPVSGEVLLPFSMDGSIYFSTLDQYKYNPALILSAEVGSEVLACTDGKVIDIFANEEIGNAVVFELGNGYQITYGQLENLDVAVGDYVEEGEVFAAVAAPTKYFSVEGSNLYLKLTAEGVPVDPELLFR